MVKNQKSWFVTLGLGILLLTADADPTRADRENF